MSQHITNRARSSRVSAYLAPTVPTYERSIYLATANGRFLVGSYDKPRQFNRAWLLINTHPRKGEREYVAVPA